MDFASELQRIQRLLQQHEYTPAATRCMIVTEQALRTVADRYLDEIDDAVKQKIHAALRKCGKRQMVRVTMGQLVRVFEEAGFLEACARTTGKNLSSLAIIDLKRLTDLRNKLFHEAQEASETEAQFLSLCLKVLLETFDISVLQAKGPDTEPADLLFRDGHALIIGVGADLPDTVNDANGMANMLRDAGRCAYPPEQVQVLTEAQAARPHILSALDNLARATDPESTVLIYFSGHGYQVSSAVGNHYYLMPHGYNIHDLARTTISGAEFAGKLKAIPAKKLLVLLDCCHAGGVGDAKVPDLHFAKKPLPPEVLPLLSEGQGRVLIASSREDELSYVGKPYSKFTVALLEALCGAGVTKQDGYVRVADLALHAREKVPGRTNDRQHPILHFEHADNFVLAYYAGGDTQPKAVPFDISTATSSNVQTEPLQENSGKTFVPGVEYDIFVSFADVDDRPRHGAKEGWVTTLIRELKTELANTLGTEKFMVWSPHQLRGNIPRSPEIRQKQQRAALFLVVLSRGFLSSEWCQQLDFLRVIREAVPQGRVFLIERDRIAPDERLAEFGEMQGYPFWIEDRVGRPPRTIGDPTPQRDPELYYERLGDLCYDVAQELQSLKRQ